MVKWQTLRTFVNVFGYCTFIVPIFVEMGFILCFCCLKMEVPVEFVVECRIDRVKAKGESSLIDYFSKTYGVLLRFYPKIGE